METKTDCGKECADIASERIRYFQGRYMSARDFSDEQRYFLSRHYLHNRIMHGWGVVCGLHVYQHPVAGCRKDHVKLDCGLAVDCCGRELVVRKPVVPPPIPWSGKPAGPAPAPQPPPPPPIQHAPAPTPAAAPQYEQAPPHPPEDTNWYPLLCLEYCESQIECVPVLYNERNCDEQRREFGRISEDVTFNWHWVRLSDLPKYHWKIRGGGCPEPKRNPDGTFEPCPDDDCYEPHEETARCCLDPDCPPDHCVPLAWIHNDGTGDITTEEIVTFGRPTLEPPTSSLTHVCHINWPHGGVVSRRHIEHHMRRLEVRFDRRLKRSHAELGTCGAWGVNPCTFIVQFGGGYEDLDFVTYTEPPHVEHDCIAVFSTDPRSRAFHHDLPFAYLENQTVFITLKCDFILDCHGIPVDGNHLGGILPSGDGVRGGTFESWFRVIPDHEWERHEQHLREPKEEQS